MASTGPPTVLSDHGTDAAVPEGGSGLQPAPIEQLLEWAIAWARQRPDIRGLALVGSWARGTARTDSDVDLVVLTTAPERYLASDDWAAALGATEVMRPQAWGDLTERRLLLEGGLEVEVGVTEPAWAATSRDGAGRPREQRPRAGHPAACGWPNWLIGKRLLAYTVGCERHLPGTRRPHKEGNPRRAQ